MEQQFTRDELIALQVLCEVRATEVRRVIKEKPGLPSVKRDNEQYVKYLEALRNKIERLIG